MKTWQNRPRVLYSLVVVVPSILVFVYLAGFASSRYVSSASLIVERDQRSAAPTLELGALIPGSSDQFKDALLVQAFVESAAMLEILERDLDFSTHFSERSRDVVFRLEQNATREQQLAYFLERIDLRVDEQSGVIDVSVEAFTPDFAHRLAVEISAAAGKFIGGIQQRLALEQVSFLSSQVEMTNRRVLRASRDLITLQQTFDIASPELESQTVAGIIARLEGQLSAEETRLRTLRSYLNESASEVVESRQRVAALREQLAQERGRQVGGQTSGLNELQLQYKDAQAEVEVATDVYRGALSSLELARLEASRQSKYLVEVSPPSIPDEAALPRPWYVATTAFLILNLMFFVASLLKAAIRDHAES